MWDSIYVHIFIYIYLWLLHVACGILVPRPGIEPRPLAVRSGVLTTGLPGNSHVGQYFLWYQVKINGILLLMGSKPLKCQEALKQS